jgi:uncharacterized RDD family membrane protein YckC
VGARIADTLIAVAVPLGLGAHQFAKTGTLDETSLVGAALLWGTLVLFVFAWLEGVKGRTPGKQLFGLRVIGLDGSPCGFGRALLRSVAGMVDGFFHGLVGILLVALGPWQQRLGDRVARTLVVRETGAADGRS